MVREFLPVCRQDMDRRGWDELDILFVSGDAYIDHPAFGVPLLARLLEAEGFRVGILAQPDWRDPQAFQIMGRPRLFAAVSAGAMDSMVNHYTAAKKIRRDDAYSPGGKSGARPNRAVIAYTAAVKGAFKDLPVVIGGIEASLRRLAHYDYWTDAVRRSILLDSKASLLIFGMGEAPLLELARRCAAGEPLEGISDLRGSARLSRTPLADSVELPSFEEVANDPLAYNEAFRLAAGEGNPFCGRPLSQRHGDRWVVVNPPALPLTQKALDRIYALPFLKRPHPGYREPVPAFEQIRFSITTHRGCCGGCAFCAIASHQGKFIQSRSEASILDEIARLAEDEQFRGTISDVGGPSANMYGLRSSDEEACRRCRRDGCLFPEPCRHLVAGDRDLVRLLDKIRSLKAVRHVFVASGVRLDLLERQPAYLETLLRNHVGGLLKVAPESLRGRVTRIMRKPDPAVFETFLERFRSRNRRSGKRLGLVPYLIAGHPGTTLDDMVETALFLKRHGLRVEQVQEFTPTPGTLATCLYHAGIDPFSGEPVHVPKSDRERRWQKALLLSHLPENRREVEAALKICGRLDALEELLGARKPMGRPAHPPQKRHPARR
jgi:uncharacterized radical SAM protein YgiQ